jgi:hypothetical protein
MLSHPLLSYEFSAVPFKNLLNDDDDPERASSIQFEANVNCQLKAKSAE